MAKQENKTGQPEQSTASHPSPKKDTILLRYPQDGSVKVVSELRIEDNKPVIITVDALTKNHPLFYERTDSRFVGQVFGLQRQQTQDYKILPELYSVSFNLVGPVATELMKLKDDPRNDIALETQKRYRVYSDNLNRIVFEQDKMPIEKLAAAGFDVEKMREGKAFEEMSFGRDTSKAYPLKLKLADGVDAEAMFCIHPFKDEYGNIQFQAKGTLAQPEFILNEELNRQITGEDQALLLSKKTLPRPILHEGEYCFMAFNAETNRMVPVPCKDVITPDFICGTRVSTPKKNELDRGGRALIENCYNYGDKENKFFGYAHYDVLSNRHIVEDTRYYKPYIPPVIREQLTPEDTATLLKFERIDGRKYKDSYGNFLTSDLCINKETNNFQFIRFQGQQKTQEQSNTQSQAEGPEQAASQSQQPTPETPGQAMDSGMIEDQTQGQSHGGPKM